MVRKLDRLTNKATEAKNVKGHYPGGDGLYLQVTATVAKS